ncbi:MAG: hypothetical protein HYZ50_15205 [Deltaproteobacteria bacterium]|nr:hypothetical protein [Deltaproteobacteria bacterium]
MARKARQEIGRLISGLSFSANRGAFVEGEWVTILVDPRWSLDAKRVDILVSCQASGHLQMDWERLAIGARSEDGSFSTLPVPLNAYGHTVLLPLPANPSQRYRCRLYEATGAIALVRHPETGAAALAAKSAAGEGDEIYTTYALWDGRLSATVTSTGSEVEVAFETSAKELAGKQVSFRLVPHEEGDVQSDDVLAGIITLEPTEQAGLWEGFCKRPVKTSQRCELLCEEPSPD